jgi:HD-GYP domain-containing protein (c-di-GMP phosphodiesterase class II)
MKKGQSHLVLVSESPTITQRPEAFPELLMNCLKSIIASLEEKDAYTHGHSVRVAEYSVILANALRLSPREIQEIELAGLLHDIGKIGIPDSVLLKSSRLNRAEFELMKSHPARSGKILAAIGPLDSILPAIRNHHERFDGQGYPDGLRGEEIPLFARIIFIADTYDAMTSTRPYRLALEKELAFRELRKYAGTQFDPDLVDAFIRAITQTNQTAENAEDDTALAA